MFDHVSNHAAGVETEIRDPWRRCRTAPHRIGGGRRGDVDDLIQVSFP
ncbi:hypothetical protein [Burkholderia diffusa]|nr:hypothetical protein [Burkholderia diffusa]